MPPEPKRGRGRLLLLALAAAALAWFWTTHAGREPEATPAPVVEAAPPVEPHAEAVEPSEPVAKELEPEPSPSPEDAGRPNLALPFCSPDDLEGVSRPTVGSYLHQHVPSESRLEALSAMLMSGAIARSEVNFPGDAPQLPDVGTSAAAERARAIAHDAERDHPSAAWPFALEYDVEKSLGSMERADAALLRAQSLDSRSFELQYALAEDLRIAGDVAGSMKALQACLQLRRDDAPIRRKLARLDVESEIESTYASAQSGGVKLLASPEFARANDLGRLADKIRSERDEAARFTGFEPRDPIFVVILPGREELMAVSCVNDWAGGFYDGTIKLIEGPRHTLRDIDLRHELVHAVALSRLHSSRPLWFTEGVADYFASPRRQHKQAEALMLANRTTIPVESLVGTLQGMGSGDADLAYAESDALVALLVDERGAGAIASAFSALRGGGDGHHLDTTVLGHAVTSDELLEFLRRRAGDSP